MVFEQQLETPRCPFDGGTRIQLTQIKGSFTKMTSAKYIVEEKERPGWYCQKFGQSVADPRCNLRGDPSGGHPSLVWEGHNIGVGARGGGEKGRKAPGRGGYLI